MNDVRLETTTINKYIWTCSRCKHGTTTSTLPGAEHICDMCKFEENLKVHRDAIKDLNIFKDTSLTPVGVDYGETKDFTGYDEFYIIGQSGQRYRIWIPDCEYPNIHVEMVE